MSAEQLLRDVLEREASSQPALPDLYVRSVAVGRRRVLRRRAAWASGMVVLLAAVLVPTLRFSRPSAAPGEQPLQPTLQALADRVRALPDEPVHTTGAWFFERRDVEASDPSAQHRSDQWWRPDGTTRVVAGGQEAESSAPTISWRELEALPKDPAALADWLRTNSPFNVGVEGMPDFQLFSTAEELLTYTPARPALRAAILEALALDKAVRVDGIVPDGSGASALAVTTTVNEPQGQSPAGTETMLLSTATGRVVGDEIGPGQSMTFEYLGMLWVPTDRTYPVGVPPQALASPSGAGRPDPAGSASVGAGSAGQPQS